MHAYDPSAVTRRQFLARTAGAAGSLALGGLLGQGLLSQTLRAGDVPAPATSGLRTHFPAKAKQVIYLHMVGGPPQMDLFDYKPGLKDKYDLDLPASIRNGQRLTTMSSGQARFPIAPSQWQFTQSGKCGMWVTQLMPKIASRADDICWMRSLYTDAINHEPAITEMQTGNMVVGRPCLGAWVSYALGTLNDKLPTFVVLVATPSNREQEQAIAGRLWSSGFLPGEHAGVPFRNQGDPIIFINNPPGVSTEVRRTELDGIDALNELSYKKTLDPEARTRISNYEMAFRMQASVPELTALDKESPTTWALYGEDAKKPGTFANSALMARRLVERGVRFVQVYHNNWDTHSNVTGRLPSQCKDVDQSCAALIEDLKQRGLFDSTLIIWGGEFGRTIYSQGGLTHDNYGRDHHPRCFTMWMSGGGSKGGAIYGETDDFSYNIVKDPMHVRDFHATVLHLLGFDHQRLTYKYQGLDARLTGTEPATVIKSLLA